ncbi:MarR family transcriptional regulator [Rhodoplanes tepidamans]|uniref:MarR family transcriptional regulator n=1 Tax=Rhodoplanes tepidamans TaxID=200616 RepID=A0ABT5JHS2_RHOTP|nr:MarR family transcriptional regulator [Rhodoplanes tepidamans]MDC7788839.1 MarR family transcriptional regulator [Rhodoplanes tepidamans]
MPAGAAPLYSGNRPMIIHEDDKGLGFLLGDAARLLRKVIDRRLQPFGLTRAQWAVLAMLASRDGLSQSELADELEIEKSTVGRLIDHVEANGLIERRPMANDRRFWRVHLTEQARPLIARVTEVILATRTEMLSGLTDEQQRRLSDGLAVIKSNLSAALDSEASKPPAPLSEPC